MTQVAHNDGVLDVRGGPDGGPSGRGHDWAHGHNGVDIVADRAHVAMYASLCRVIESAPVQNKLVVFGMMAGTAAADAAAYRQQVIDDLWEVASDLGLVSIFGVTSVQGVLAAAFAEGTS